MLVCFTLPRETEVILPALKYQCYEMKLLQNSLMQLWWCEIDILASLKALTLLEILLTHPWRKLSFGKAIENQSTQCSPDANICQLCCPNWKQTIWCRPMYIYVYRAGASATIHNNYVRRANRRLLASSSPSFPFGSKKEAQWAFRNTCINIIRQAWALGQMDRTQTGI